MDEKRRKEGALMRVGRKAVIKDEGRRRCGQWASKVAPPDQPPTQGRERIKGRE